MFPEAQYRPTGVAERRVCARIAGDVPIELRSPPLTVCRWPRGMYWAAVPEASVDKHRQPMAREGDIDVSARVGESFVLHAETKTLSKQSRAGGKFRQRVSPSIRLH